MAASIKEKTVHAKHRAQKISFFLKLNFYDCQYYSDFNKIFMINAKIILNKKV